MGRVSKICLFLMTLSVACSNKSAENKNPFVAQGVQDSGGGSATKSSPDEVNAALDLALSLVSDPDARKNIIVHFWTDWGHRSQKEFIKNPKALFPDLNLNPNVDGFFKGHDLAVQFQSPTLSALKRNKITRRLNGECALIDREHKDASVAKFTSDSDMCFSIGNLTRIPSSSLLREVTALVVHEVVHLAGISDESQAVAWQTEFSNYFGARFGDLSTDTVTPRTMRKLAEAKILLGQAQGFARANPKGPHVYAAIGKLAKELSTIPNFLDPLALQLKLKAEHPELIGNYSNAILAVLEKIQAHFDIHYLKVFFMLPHPIDLTTPEQISQALIDLEKMLWQINENFLAFVGGETEAKSVCILPTRDLDLKSFDTNQMGAADNTRVFIPPRACP